MRQERERERERKSEKQKECERQGERDEKMMRVIRNEPRELSIEMRRKIR